MAQYYLKSTLCTNIVTSLLDYERSDECIDFKIICVCFFVVFDFWLQYEYTI